MNFKDINKLTCEEGKVLCFSHKESIPIVGHRCSVGSQNEIIVSYITCSAGSFTWRIPISDFSYYLPIFNNN